MDVIKIHTKDTDEISNLAVACFMEDHYFIKMFPEEQERKEKLKEMFQDSISYCSREDGAYGIKKDGCWVAFALFFDYDRLNKSDDKQMRRFFGFASDKKSRYRAMREPETSDQNFIKLKAEECGIRSTYLLSIGVDETHRNAGLATKLVKFIRSSFPNNYLISDISNPLSLRLYEKLGFQQSQISTDYYWVSSSPLLDVRNVEDEKIYLA
ncbi:MAG: family N-acetyltransferase, partial [Caproiciproducens sp.]|nr:family N-acetyltransferase [Caproiciproducens sp.]